jgi:polysaccharide pyruvyl transferase CsaB
MEKVVLGGYFGFGNIGDEAILLSEINFLKKDGYEPIVLTNRGIKVFECESINRYNFFKIFLKKREFNKFILGGGGLFQDKTSFRSLIYYIFLIYFMKLLKKKVILFNVGIGPIKRSLSKKLIIESFKISDLIILRDKYSYDFLPEFKNKFLSSDSTFSIFFNNVERGDFVLLSLRYFDNLNLDRFKNFLKLIKNRYDLNIEFIVFSKEEIKIAEYLNLRYFHSNDIIEIINKIASSSFLIGTRYHSIIFSIITNTPFIGFIYDIKVKNLIDELGLKNYISPEDPIEDWINKFCEFYENRESLNDSIKSKKSELIDRVKFGFEILRKFLKYESI